MNILQRAIRNLNLFTGTYNEKLLKYFKYAGATSSVLQDAEKQYLIGKLGNKAYANQDYWKELEAVYGTSEQLIANDVARANGAVLYTVPDNYMTLGPELVVNGDFSQGNTGWSLAPGWSVVGGALVGTSVQNYISANQAITLSAGKMYKVSYTVTELLSGTFRAYFTVGANSIGIERTSVGSYSETLVANSGNTTLALSSAGTGFRGKVGAVSVREILSDTLYQDSTGVTPVSTVGQLVGLMLDSTATVGAELVNPASWALSQPTSGSVTNTSGVISVNSTDGTYAAAVQGAAAINKSYRLSGIVSNLTGNGIAVAIGAQVYVPQNGAFSVVLVAPTISPFEIKRANGIGAGTVSNFSVKEIPGTHATQATTANKPTLVRGLYNLLTYSNDLSSAAWSANNGAVRQSSTQASFTTNASDTVLHTAMTVVPGVQMTAAFVVSGDVGKQIKLRIEDNGAPYGGAEQTVTLTATPTLYVLNYASTLTTVIPFIRGMGQACTVTLGGAGFFAGTLTAAQILANGGISLTTSAAGWNQIAGRHLLSFDGVNDTLTFTPQPITTQATLVWAGSLDDLATARGLFGQGAGGFALWVSTTGQIDVGQNSGVFIVSGNGVVAPNVPIVISATTQVGGNTVLRVNGVQILQGAAPASAYSGSTITLGSLGGGTFWHKGTVGFCEVSNTILSLADLQAAERAAAKSVGVEL